jgi:hypothetical protein
MKFYTLISLVLSVFGATYAALAALRSQLEDFFKKAKEEAAIHVDKVNQAFADQASQEKKTPQDEKDGLMEILRYGNTVI